MKRIMAIAMMFVATTMIAQTHKSVCYDGHRDANGQFTYTEIPCEKYAMALPDAPSALRASVSEAKPAQVTFWTFGRFDAPKSLRSNRQTLSSPWFWGTHAAAFGVSIWNVRRSRAAGGNYPDALVPLAAVGGFDFIMDRYVCRAFSFAGAAYATILRTHGAITRTYQ